MLKKFCHWLFGLSSVAGLILAIGAAGVLEWNTKLIVASMSVVLLTIGYIGLRLSGWEHLN